MATQQLVKKDQVTTIRDLLTKNAEQIKLALPKHVSADRMQRAVLTACLQSPKLYECTQQSMMMSVLRAAQMGLEPDGILGYLVPYKTTAQFLPSYRGLVQLARQSGEIASITARAVRAGDEFDFSLGTDEYIRHKPLVSDDDEERAVTYVYAVARFRDKETPPQFDVMTRAQVERVRARVSSGREGPWFTDWEEMAKKTVVRRLSKLLPISVHMRQALAEEEALEQGKPLVVADLAIVTDDTPPPAKVSKLDQVVAERRAAVEQNKNDEPPLSDPQPAAATSSPTTPAGPSDSLRARAHMGEQDAIDELTSAGWSKGEAFEVNIDKLPAGLGAKWRAFMTAPKKGA